MRIACRGFLLLALFGCGSSEPVPVAVTGSVTLDGKPLAEGKISFVTLGTVPEIIDITDGHYAGKVLPGERRVEIAAYRPYQIPPEVPKSMYPLMQSGKENYLPLKYHRESILTATVTEKGDNTFNFDVVTREE